MLEQLADAERSNRQALLLHQQQQQQQQPGGGCGQLHMHVLPRAGHWLQADNPEGLTQLMLPWFRTRSDGPTPTP